MHIQIYNDKEVGGTWQGKIVNHSISTSFDGIVSELHRAQAVKLS